MNIIFNHTQTEVQNHSNVTRETTGYRSSERTGKVQTENFALDISGTVMDNNAYVGHGRTTEEVMRETGEQDLVNRRNYMAVMSNSMSDEDFAALQKEGFHPGSTEIDTVVTIVDEIKAALLKGGTEVVGYTDTLDMAKLEQITGSKAFAGELQKQFQEADLPLTEEMAKSVTAAYQMLNQAGEPTEGTQKYIIENQLTVSADNLYFAKYAGTGDTGIQSQGYYMAGNVPGYLAKKSNELSLEELKPQMEKVISDAGYPVEGATLSDAEWIVKNGMPLTEESYSRLQEMKQIRFPIEEAEFIKSVTAALQDGIAPKDADLTQAESMLYKAARLTEDQQTTIKKQIEELKGSGASTLEKRRTLEETRLVMTVSANLKLLKSGFQIETASMEETIKQLKEAQAEIDQVLMKENDPELALKKGNLYRETLFTLEGIRLSPAAILAETVESDTLPEVEQKGAFRAAAYQKAGETYEALGTAARSDLGDSIQKAFQNVDVILEELGKELTEENRKTVRILGYNRMDMTIEHFERVQEIQEKLSNVLEKMKPSNVLSMIRNGENPLKMTLSELDDFLDQQEDSPNQEQRKQELESYSRFLYKLEQNAEVTEAERSAYIGIYRLLHQMEKTDFAAVGAVIDSGKQETLENLLSAIRTSKKKPMDYQVGDGFEIFSLKNEKASISEQIEKAFHLEESDLQEAEKAFEEQGFEEIRSTASKEQEALRYLTDYQQPFTAEMLMAAGTILRSPSEPFKRLREILEDQEAEETKEALERLKDKELIDSLEDQESAENVSEAYMEACKQSLEQAAYETVDRFLGMKGILELYNEFHFLGNMAKEENYTIPLEIDGELTAVNLKMIHKAGADSKACISLETEAVGKNVAEFTVTQGRLTGYSVSDSRAGEQLLKSQETALQELFSEESLELQEMHVMFHKDLDLQEYSLRSEKERMTGKASNMLYRAAKTYIRFITQISRKEVSSNEN